MNAMLPVTMLIKREIIRFLRQRSRMIGVLLSPILFWLMIGSGLKHSFRLLDGPPDVTYLEYFYPGSVVLIVLFSAVFSSISVIEDRKEGFLQSVLVSPVPRTSIVFGKVLGITALAIGQASLFLALAPLASSQATFGSMLLTLAVLAIVAFALSCFGFLIAWSVDSTQGFHGIMNLLLMPMWMLSGALFPTSGAAGWVATLMRLNPLSYGVAATRQSLYGLDPHYTRDLPSFGGSLLVVVCFAVGIFLVAIWRVGIRERGAAVTIVKGED